ncbi:MAG: hypothetical protein C4567_13065 [Deltaproteobacteria bacterium]|nr:MAG: hypothetical protein C4567_13065 [Deltaproteobacteria bacterium]
MAGKGSSEGARFSGLAALLLLAACFSCLCLPAAAWGGGVVQEWERRYNMLEPGSWDKPTAMAVDTAGNVYVTGWSQRHGTNWDFDYATIKYSPAGEELWVRRYIGPVNGDNYASAIAVDLQGNVYVTGRSDGPGNRIDYTTIKYAVDGQQLWVRRYHTSENGSHFPRAMVVDSQGNVYVTGASNSWESGTGFDFATIKYDTNGKRLWVRRYDGPGNGSDWPNAMAVDHRGNVYITGESEGLGTGYDYATIMYDSKGREIWVSRYQGPGIATLYNDDYARAIAVDGQGNVYVTGASSEKWGDYHCFTTIKYSQRGKELWVRRHQSPGFGATGIALDSQGNAYVTGYVNGSWNGWLALRNLTIKYDKNGRKLWARCAKGWTAYSSTYNYDVAPAIAVDSQGNAYITDNSAVEGNPWGSVGNLRTLKYDTNGKLQWEERYQNYSIARAIALDGQGHIYVNCEGYGGGGGDQTGYDYLTIKYTQNPEASR